MMEAFLHACGVDPALELEVEATGSTTAIRYCLPQPFALIGRHPAADVHLDADGVRPRHLYLQAVEGRIACINVSETSSFVALEKEVDSFCWLPTYQSVRVGAKRLKLLPYDEVVTEEKEELVVNPLLPGSALDIFAPRLTLEMTNEEAPGVTKLWSVDRLLTLVGRTRKCPIQLNHELISNVHCSLVLTTSGLWVVDLLGRGGILINEQPVRFGQLGMEDELRLGPFRVRLQEILDIPEDENAYKSLTPAGEFELPETSRPDSNLHIRNYHTHWPEDVEQADVLEALMDQFQSMEGPLFAQHQHMLTRMIGAFSDLKPEEREAVKSELKRLRRIREEVESIQQGKEPAETMEAIVLPDTPASLPKVNVPRMSSGSEPLSDHTPNTAASTPTGRSASSLLNNTGMSVFRIPKKTGDLFESAPSSEVDSKSDQSQHTWSEGETEILPADMVNDAQQLNGFSQGNDTGINYGYDPNQHETSHPNPAEYQPFIPPHPEADHPVTDKEKEAHLWLHDRIDVLQEEQSSIWQKLSQFFFGKSSW